MKLAQAFLKSSRSVLLVIFCSFGLIINTFSQTQQKDTISFKFDSTPLISVLESLKNQLNLDIAYSSSIIPTDLPITINVQNQDLRKSFAVLFENTQIDFEIKGNRVVLFPRKVQNYSIHGFIYNNENGEQLIGATIYCDSIGRGAVSNEFGFYNLILPEGLHRVSFSYVGKSSQEVKIQVHTSKKLDSYLSGLESLQEVLVIQKGESYKTLQEVKYNQRDLLNYSINTPGIAGESDLLQTARSLPGIKSAAGGIGGYYVRGGSNGQNLILLDGVPVYNPSHIAGLYSIFNPRAARSMGIQKGGFSSRYGGRLSSVIDVQSREGNRENWAYELGLSPQSAHLTIEGPMFKDEGSVLISARQSLFGPYIKPVINKSFFPVEGTKLDFNYQDVNLKLNREFSEKDRIYLSIYGGGDNVKGELEAEEEEFGEIESKLKWGNALISLRWNRIINQKWFNNLTVHFSQFSSMSTIFEDFAPNAEEEDEEDYFYLDFRSLIREWSLKSDSEYFFSNSNRFNLGGGISFYSFRPQAIVIDEESGINAGQNSLNLNFFENEFKGGIELPAFEAFIYMEENLDLSKGTNLIFGLRQSIFSNRGKSFYHLEPRVNITQKISSKFILSASLSKMVQNLHLISNSEFTIPMDLWAPANDLLPPETAWQYDIGVQFFPTSDFNFRFETFYKKMDGLLQLTDELLALTAENQLEENVIMGNGISYGIELTLEKSKSKFNFLSSYSLSIADRHFEDLNQGNRFAFQFDRLHEWKNILTYAFHPNWTLGAKSYLGSGHPILASKGGSLVLGVSPSSIDPEGMKNSSRSGWHHHLDLSVRFTKSTGRFKHSLKASIYNSYNQSNPVFYNIDNNDPANIVISPALNIPLIPSIEYTLSF